MGKPRLSTMVKSANIPPIFLNGPELFKNMEHLPGPEPGIYLKETRSIWV
jgi:hypothetical protein